MSEWIEWKGGECPVAAGTLVDVQYRNGSVMHAMPANEMVAGSSEDASKDFWRHDGFVNDIIAYRIIDAQPSPTPAAQAQWDNAGMPTETTPANARQVAGTHYKDMGVEPWDVVDTWPIEQRIGAYRHGALKYLMRMGSKDESAQEIAKGIHYMEKLLEVLKAQ